jgi:NitT/TauT family transport system substrate-binding protein
MRHPAATAAILVLLAATATPAFPAAPAAFTLALDGPLAAPHAAYLHAVASGAFSAAGLAVVLRSPAGRGAALEALLAGAADACVADAVAVIAARSGGSGVTIAATVGDLHPAVVVSREAAPIGTPAGLAGRRIAVEALDPDRLLLPVYLAGAGLRLEDVTVVPLDAPARDAALAAGTVDAAIARGGDALPGARTLPWADHGFSLYGPCIAVRDETLRTRPAVVRSFLAAVLKSWEACLEDPASAAVVAASSGLVAAADVEMWLQAETWRFDTDAYREKGLGWIDRARMVATVEAVGAVLGAPAVPAADGVFAAAYLPSPPVLRKAAGEGTAAPATPPLKR